METLRRGDPRQVGPYRLEARLGEGGMGQVFLGSTPGGRQVAVKLIRAEHAGNPQFRARFAREVDAARKVGGFYTAQVVDADPAADEPWMVTAFVPGPSLRELVTREGPLDPGGVRSLGRGLVEGLAAIHACGLVHRDLKPGNVIMSPDGPRIIDFGIARAADASTLTATGAAVGTFAYMAPEQIRADEAGPPADVFALGCVLVFAATGRGPFDAGSIPAIVHRITSSPPDLGGMDTGLQGAIVPCLAKDPAARPPLPQIGAGLTAAPRRVPRRAVIAGAAGAAVAAIAAPAAVLLWPSGESKAKTFPPTPLDVPGASRLLPGGPVDMFDIAFTPDSRTLVGVGFESLWRWDLTTGKGGSTEVGEALRGRDYAGLSGDARVVAVKSDAGIELRDAATGRVTGVIKVGAGFHALGLSHDAGRVGTAGAGKIRILDARTGRAVREIAYGESDPTFLEFSPDGRLIATGNRYSGGVANLWDTASGRPAGTLSGGTTETVTFSPDGSLAAGVDDGNWAVHLWNVEAGQSPTVLEGHEGAVLSLAFSPDGRVLASGSKDNSVRLWNTRTAEPIGTLSGHTTEVSTVAFAPDGTMLAAAAGSGSGATRLWSYR
ncbi:WD40 repeat domain-containing serine/threonine protein kinase [Spirillospora sp. NPDC048823]|uniref:WD40 repeat domain-containing serine/threonine protein kinase n=1 Tax=unclassified Spirillospora TaxID=2642701 RepID=UPI003720F393